MTKTGHRQTGIGIGMIGAACAAQPLGWPDAVLVGFVSVLASSLPDNLEIKWWWGGERFSLIPHRTLTHWLPLWGAATAWMWMVGLTQFSHPINIILLGLCIGALGHVIMDWLTPMGIPVALLPWRRHSLRMVHSGGPSEVSVAMVLFVAGLFALVSSLGFSLAGSP